MDAVPFGLNVVSRNFAVVCSVCDASARQVGSSCPTCGTDFTKSGFRVVPVAAQPSLWRRAVVRRPGATVA
jgi:predicted amidophosphoribosyltransferase